MNVERVANGNIFEKIWNLNECYECNYVVSATIDQIATKTTKEKRRRRVYDERMWVAVTKECDSERERVWHDRQTYATNVCVTEWGEVCVVMIQHKWYCQCSVERSETKCRIHTHSEWGYRQLRSTLERRTITCLLFWLNLMLNTNKTEIMNVVRMCWEQTHAHACTTALAVDASNRTW